MSVAGAIHQIAILGLLYATAGSSRADETYRLASAHNADELTRIEASLHVGGDVKLSGVLGLYLGWLGAAAAAGLLGAFVLAALAGLGLIAAGRATRKSQIPFGPFMLASAIAVIAASGLAGSHFP